jgi:hypothetical protein
MSPRRRARPLPGALLSAGALLLAGAVALSGPAAADWFGGGKPQPVEKRVPACDDTAVQAKLVHSIASADPRYYGVTVKELKHIEQSALVDNQDSPLARRYCTARLVVDPLAANLPQGKAPPKNVLFGDEPAPTQPHERFAYYMVEEKAGFVGISWNVEVCISGLDRWRVYDGQCETVRPPPTQ